MGTLAEHFFTLHPAFWAKLNLAGSSVEVIRWISCIDSRYDPSSLTVTNALHLCRGKHHVALRQTHFSVYDFDWAKRQLFTQKWSRYQSHSYLHEFSFLSLAQYRSLSFFNFLFQACFFSFHVFFSSSVHTVSFIINMLFINSGISMQARHSAMQTHTLQANTHTMDN